MPFHEHEAYLDRFLRRFLIVPKNGLSNIQKQ